MLEAVQASSHSPENDFRMGKMKGDINKSYRDVSIYTYTYILRESMLYSYGYRVYTCPMHKSDFRLSIIYLPSRFTGGL